MTGVDGAVVAQDGTASPRRRPRLAVRLVGAALSLLIALGIAEGIVRTFYPQSDFFSRSDDTIGVLGIPDRNGMMHDPEFTTHVTTNSFGFRDKERTVAKPPGTKRVLVLGDSFTEGLQVEFEQTYRALLEARLQKDLGAKAVELVGMGLPGVGTTHEMLVYENYGVRFAPDVVLVTWFSGNDRWDNYPPGKYYYPGFELGPGPDELVPVAPREKQVGSDGLLGRIVRTNRCQLLSFVARTYRRYWLVRESKKQASAPRPELPPPPPPRSPGPPGQPGPQGAAPTAAELFAKMSALDREMWEITRRVFKRFRDEVAAHGAVLVVGMIPEDKDLDHHLESVPLSAILDDLGVPHVDLAPALRAAHAENPDARLYFEVDKHFTARGHASIVEPLAGLIEPILRGSR